MFDLMKISQLHNVRQVGLAAWRNLDASLAGQRVELHHTVRPELVEGVDHHQAERLATLRRSPRQALGERSVEGADIAFYVYLLLTFPSISAWRLSIITGLR